MALINENKSSWRQDHLFHLGEVGMDMQLLMATGSLLMASAPPTRSSRSTSMNDSGWKSQRLRRRRAESSCILRSFRKLTISAPSSMQIISIIKIKAITAPNYWMDNRVRARATVLTQRWPQIRQKRFSRHNLQTSTTTCAAIHKRNTVSVGIY